MTVDRSAELARVAEAARGIADPSDSEIVTNQVLLGLADLDAGEAGERRTALEALARKVHLAKSVMAGYGARWKKLKTAEPLPRESWPLLVAVLLAHADASDAVSEDDRGMALKCLNAGLAAIDRAAALDAADCELEAWAQELLAGATEGWS